MAGTKTFKRQGPFWAFQLALMTILLLETGLSDAARIHMKNGRVIDGVVMSKGGGLVVIDTGGTKIELFEKDVARIEEASPAAESLRLLGDDIRLKQWPQAEALAGKIRQMTLAPHEERELQALVKIIEEGKEGQGASKLEISVIREAQAALQRSEEPRHAIEILRQAIAEHDDFRLARIELLRVYENLSKIHGFGWGSNPEALLARTEQVLTSGALSRADRREMVSLFTQATERIAAGKKLPAESPSGADELLAMAALLESGDSSIAPGVTDGIVRKTARARYYGKLSPTKDEMLLGVALGYLWGKQWAKEKKPLEAVVSKIEREHSEEFLAAAASSPDQAWQALAAAAILSQNAKFAEALKGRDVALTRKCAQGLLTLFNLPRTGQGAQVTNGASFGGPSLRVPAALSRLRRESPQSLLDLVRTSDCPGTTVLCLCLDDEVANACPQLLCWFSLNPTVGVRS